MSLGNAHGGSAPSDKPRIEDEQFAGLRSAAHRPRAARQLSTVTTIRAPGVPEESCCGTSSTPTSRRARSTAQDC